MKIAIMGAGGIGGYFGARLAAAGNRVGFIARGAHRDAMIRNGLKIHSPLGDLHVKAPRVTDDPGVIGDCDLVICCVKLWDLELTAEAIRPLVDENSSVLSLQNGVSAETRLAETLGAARVECVAGDDASLAVIQAGLRLVREAPASLERLGAGS